MKPAIFLPVYLEPGPSATFERIVTALRELTAGLVEWLAPTQISQAPALLAEADAVVVPDFSGLVYHQLTCFKALAPVPVILATSDHGTVFMWDWEGRDWLRRRGVPTLAPNSLVEFHDLARALAVRRELPGAKMLAYWDDLGAGQQPDIFKRFFWWEDECSDLLRSRLGVSVIKRSFRDLVARAAVIPAARIEAELARRTVGPVVGRLSRHAQDQAVRLKLALEDDLDETPGVIAAGVNCLNESDTSLTTPCFAWNQLFAERGLIWGCEADLTSM
ncbi:MAG: hypothetical protein LBU05_01255, partial [Bifidobacteriaceae bacterium]|nr:hypothetical protein [Bifidobacteriaceae bacterium]